MAQTAPDDGLLVALIGPLGAGKTLFAKALAEALGVPSEQLASPTFTIANQYVVGGRVRLAHVDLYRIESESELEAAGFRDLLEPGRWIAVEWADRFPEALPADRLELVLARGARVGQDSGPDPSAAGAGEQERGLEARALGPRAAELLRDWRERIGALAFEELEELAWHS